LSLSTKKRVSAAIIAATALISLVAWILLNRAAYDSPTALIYKDNVLLYEIDLSNVAAAYKIDTGGNIIEVRGGEIGVIYANCRDKVCVRTGFTHGVVPVICLPNRLEIRVVNKTDYDVLAY